METARNAEVVAALREELAALRAEMPRREELEPLARQMQSALLTIALNHGEADRET